MVSLPPAKAGVERMNRTIKEATVKRYHYDSHAQLIAHLHDLINAYNYGRRLETLRGLTPLNTSANAGQMSQNDSP